jgi:hypothetical protein
MGFTSRKMEGIPMKTKIRHIAPALAALAFAGSIAAAPAAIAAPTSPHPTAPTAAAPTPPGDGSDPLVPANTGANPFVFIPQGDELPG